MSLESRSTKKIPPDHSDLIANATFQDKGSYSRMNSYKHVIIQLRLTKL